MKTIIATLAIAASIGGAHATMRPRYCIDACTGRFCYFADGYQVKELCFPNNPRSCIKNYKGILILKQDQNAVCGP